MPRANNSSTQVTAQQQQDQVSEGIDNFELPKSLVTKIARSAIPDSAKLQKESVLSLVKGSTVFINYLAATAHDVALSKQHKSISASDVIKALEMMEFGDIVEQLQAELLVYRELAKTDKSKRGQSGGGGDKSSTTSAPPLSSANSGGGSGGGGNDPISGVGSTPGGHAIIGPGVPGHSNSTAAASASASASASGGGTTSAGVDGDPKISIILPLGKAKKGVVPVGGGEKGGKKGKGKEKDGEGEGEKEDGGATTTTTTGKSKSKGKGKAKEILQPPPAADVEVEADEIVPMEVDDQDGGASIPADSVDPSDEADGDETEGYDQDEEDEVDGGEDEDVGDDDDDEGDEGDEGEGEIEDMMEVEEEEMKKDSKGLNDAMVKHNIRDADD
ncbi:hypothetical protein BDN72DRAFT_683164 [Pluteus cervinus]|uniref:Uncharacterized protein n=1 Tax=Pluteus cervinus TaxID=181527 RepID=A0ACD3ARI5_9AGAR|nr:hypothetical protein BDN72DRAFT_683164 [Pluteus cervinus]